LRIAPQSGSLTVSVERPLVFYDPRVLGSIVPKSAHIAALERRYKALEAEIAEALIDNSTDDVMIVALKRRLLHLRDEIFRHQYEDEVEGRPPIIHH